MRRLCSALIVTSLIWCMSTSTSVASGRLTCEDRYDRVFVAAQSAVMAIGGKIIHASRSSGTIVGEIDVDVHGFNVQLTINLSRIPDHNPTTVEPITVTVKAIEPGVKKPDRHRKDELRALEDQYLALVAERTACS